MDSSSDIQVVEEMTSTEYTPVKTIETEVQGVSCQTMISNLALSKIRIPRVYLDMYRPETF